MEETEGWDLLPHFRPFNLSGFLSGRQMNESCVSPAVIKGICCKSHRQGDYSRYEIYKNITNSFLFDMPFVWIDTSRCEPS